MAKTNPINVVRDPVNPEAVEIIAQSIMDIAAGMKRISDSRLHRRALVTLIHESSKVPRRDIEIVLNNLESLEATWLKPLPRK